MSSAIDLRRGDWTDVLVSGDVDKSVGEWVSVNVRLLSGIDEDVEKMTPSFNWCWIELVVLGVGMDAARSQATAMIVIKCEPKQGVEWWEVDKMIRDQEPNSKETNEKYLGPSVVCRRALVPLSEIRHSLKQNIHKTRKPIMMIQRNQTMKQTNSKHAHTLKYSKQLYKLN